ncbi:MAG: acid phosphatase, partial [Candidatus Riflebacteria bacterium]|nr:acid phosphatase [Candidatus Riflebacteria bacterium]
MKKILLILFLVFMGSVCYAKARPFLTEEETPTGAKFLPLPPKPTEASFYNDWLRYQWGKSIRNTERGKQAIDDAVHTLEYFSKIYSEPLGIEISSKSTPEILTLLERLLETTYLCVQKSKSRFMR